MMLKHTRDIQTATAAPNTDFRYARMAALSPTPRIVTQGVSFATTLQGVLKKELTQPAAPPQSAIPYETQTPAYAGMAATPRSPTLYEVKRGDTLWRIAANALKGQGLPSSTEEIARAVTYLARANNLKNPDRLAVGQRLDMSVLMASSSAPRAAAPTPSPEEPAGFRSLPKNTPQALLAASPEERKTAQPSVTPSAPSLAEAVGGPIYPLFLRNNVIARHPAVVPPAHPADKNTQENNTVPLPFQISSPFGVRLDPFTLKPAFHAGVDIAVPHSTPIYPVSPGIVTFSGWKPGYGKVVIVKHHDGHETLYAHTSVNLVRVGASVKTDTPLALSGGTGRATGPHLHFEVRRDGKTIPPDVFRDKLHAMLLRAGNTK